MEETPETNADRFLASLPSEVPEDLSRRLTWSYAFPGAANTPGKLTATAAVKLRETLEASEAMNRRMPLKSWHRTFLPFLKRKRAKKMRKQKE